MKKIIAGLRLAVALSVLVAVFPGGEARAQVFRGAAAASSASAASRASAASTAGGATRLAPPAAAVTAAASFRVPAAGFAAPSAGLAAPVAGFAAAAAAPGAAPAAAPAPAPAPNSAEGEASPQARQILARARAKAVADEAIGNLIQSSRNLDAAAAKLRDGGVLEPSETSLVTPQQRRAFNVLLHELWHDVAPATPRQFGFDHDAAVPATVVERDGITFHIHGLAHGPAGAVFGAKDVRKMAKELSARPQTALYSEQNLPWAYGYSGGLEFLDHRILKGGKMAVRKPALDGIKPSEPARRAEAKAKVRAMMATVESILAGMAPAEARLLKAFLGPQLQTGKPDLELIRRVMLPFPLVGSLSEEERILALDSNHTSEQMTFRRSAAMAAAALEDAVKKGVREVHLIVGFGHAWDIAWLLSQPSSPVLDAARADYRAPAAARDAKK